jgi:hypothetical protein
LLVVELAALPEVVEDDTMIEDDISMDLFSLHSSLLNLCNPSSTAEVNREVGFEMES